jgi:hypothetical protein
MSPEMMETTCDCISPHPFAVISYEPAVHRSAESDIRISALLSQPACEMRILLFVNSDIHPLSALSLAFDYICTNLTVEKDRCNK